MTVSVIIPVYNAEKYIRKSLTNYLMQTYEDIEFIIIDDGSTDKTPEICDEFARENKKIKVFHQNNQGVSAARNFGLKRANGNYIAFFDTDDFVDENMVDAMINQIKLTKADIACCGISMVLEKQDGKLLQQYDQKPSDKVTYYEGHDYIKNNIVEIWENAIPYNVVNKIYKKSLLSNNKIEFSNLTLGEDLEFNSKVLGVCDKIVMLPECFYKYVRDREGAATAKYINNWFQIRLDEHIRILKFFENLYFPYAVPQEASEFASRRFVNRSIGCIENEFRIKNSIGERYKNISRIVKSNDLQNAIRIGKNYSIKIKIILLPIKYKSVLLTYMLGYSISLVRSIFPRLFEFLKYRR